MRLLDNDQFLQGLVSLIDPARDIDDCWINYRPTQEQIDSTKQGLIPLELEDGETLPDPYTQVVETLESNTPFMDAPCLYVMFANGQVFKLRFEEVDLDEMVQAQGHRIDRP